MSNSWLVVAGKEITETLRDKRALYSSLLYTLMGPIVVGLVAFTSATPRRDEAGDTLFALASVFTLIAGFSGGMQVAMDAFAGERERRSLLPLLTNPVSRLSIAAGKWVAIACFGTCALLLNLICFGIILENANLHSLGNIRVSSIATIILLGLIPLTLLAASAELVVSIFCRSLKEAHTYLAFVVFAPLVVGMFLTFSPHKSSWWLGSIPVLGQQSMMTMAAHGVSTPPASATVLCMTTLGLTVACLIYAAITLERDENVYGQ